VLLLLNWITQQKVHSSSIFFGVYDGSHALRSDIFTYKFLIKYKKGISFRYTQMVIKDFFSLLWFSHSRFWISTLLIVKTKSPHQRKGWWRRRTRDDEWGKITGSLWIW
jgi:hypothetical protein